MEKWIVPNQRKAFTLMELAAVAAIVGILAVLSLPNYIKAVRKADERNAIVNLKAIRHIIFCATTSDLTFYNCITGSNRS